MYRILQLDNKLQSESCPKHQSPGCGSAMMSARLIGFAERRAEIAGYALQLGVAACICTLPPSAFPQVQAHILYLSLSDPYGKTCDAFQTLDLC